MIYRNYSANGYEYYARNYPKAILTSEEIKLVLKYITQAAFPKDVDVRHNLLLYYWYDAAVGSGDSFVLLIDTEYIWITPRWDE